MPGRTVVGLRLITAVHGDHLVALANVSDLRAEVGDASTIAVNEKQRLAGPIDLVVELHSIMNEGAAD